MAVDKGKQFELDVQNSAQKQGVFFYRIKDTSLPQHLRGTVPIAKNDFDSFMYDHPHLYALELKSTKAKSVSMQESVIKQHQLDKLWDASLHDGVIAGLLFNFREPENEAYFVPIEKFWEYQIVAYGQLEGKYESKINKSSIPIAIVREIGVPVECTKLRVNYRYDMKKLSEDLKKLYNVALQ